MFGALLGVIGGGAGARGGERQKGSLSDSVAKRRLEIEKRTQEKLKQVNEESKAFHAEQREQLKKKRQKYQWDLDEHGVRLQAYITRRPRLTLRLDEDKTSKHARSCAQSSNESTPKNCRLLS
jgi:hypothetical protein